MDKTKIVKELFDRGVLVTPEILQQATEKNIDDIISTNQTIVNTLPEKRVELVVPEERTTLSVKDYADFYKEKYNGIREMLSKKLSPTSISNTTKNFAEVSVICMVRELTPSGFIVEDTTGDIEVLTTKRVQIGDVVGVNGYVREGRLVENDIIYPDIPLPKEVKRFNVVIALTRKAVSGEDVQVVFGDSGGGDVVVSKSPAQLLLNGVHILVFEGNGDPQEWLKKRHLPEKVTSPHDFYLIRDVPDVIWVLGEKNKTESYKGVTIVQTDKESFARVNMFTREVVFEKI